MPTINIDIAGKTTVTPLDPEAWKKTLRRVLVHGEPLSGKTTCLMSFPAPRHILIAPGELGYSSIQEDENTKIYYFEPQDSMMDYRHIWIQVQQWTRDILSGKHGEVTTFAIDGLHKIYAAIMKARGHTPDTDAKAFSGYHDAFNNFMIPIIAGPTKYVVATCYDGSEQIETGSKTNKDMALWPDLPGQMAKKVMGMFPVVIHTKRSGVGKEQYFWELQASQTMRGVGVHVPTRLRQNLPAFCEPNWEVFERMLLESAVPVTKQLTK